MRRMFRFLHMISLIFLLFSCCKLFDDELSIERTNYTGAELRIDGYYYSETFEPPYPNYCVAKSFFYRNGVKLGACSYDTTEMSVEEYYATLKKSKLNWYVFKIEGNTITIEGWDNLTQTFKEYGEILNDTTFRISKIERSGRTDKSNSIYHFKQFSPKPDSTNSFIK